MNTAKRSPQKYFLKDLNVVRISYFMFWNRKNNYVNDNMFNLT